MAPVTFTVGFQSWSPGTSFIINCKGLWIILMLVVTTLPAASVAVKVNSFVPPTKGRFSAHQFPSRSTNTGTKFVFPLASTIWAVNCAVKSSTMLLRLMTRHRLINNNSNPARFFVHSKFLSFHIEGYNNLFATQIYRIYPIRFDEFSDIR